VIGRVISLIPVSVAAPHMACEDTLGNALDRYKKEAKGKID